MTWNALKYKKINRTTLRIPKSKSIIYKSNNKISNNLSQESLQGMDSLNYCHKKNQNKTILHPCMHKLLLLNLFHNHWIHKGYVFTTISNLIGT